MFKTDPLLLYIILASSAKSSTIIRHGHGPVHYFIENNENVTVEVVQELIKIIENEINVIPILESDPATLTRLDR